MVGKQGWRLITNETSLVSRIYKARYYPHNSFSTTKVGKNPSYVWRNIMGAQILLKKGVVRRVGSGIQVKIHEPYIQTRSEAIEGKTVASLMVTDKIEWDIELVNDIFDERDANMILSIPLGVNEADSW